MKKKLKLRKCDNGGGLGGYNAPTSKLDSVNSNFLKAKDPTQSGSSNAVGNLSSVASVVSNLMQYIPKEQQQVNQVGINDYFKNQQKINQNADTISGTVGGVVGSIFPIAGAAKGIGEGADELLAPKNQYGFSDKSDLSVGAAKIFNPEEQTMKAIDNVSKGDWGLDTFVNFNLPGLGGIMENDKAKKEYAGLQQKQQQQVLSNNFNSQIDSNNKFSGKSTFAFGGKIGDPSVGDASKMLNETKDKLKNNLSEIQRRRETIYTPTLMKIKGYTDPSQIKETDFMTTNQMDSTNRTEKITDWEEKARFQTKFNDVYGGGNSNLLGKNETLNLGDDLSSILYGKKMAFEPFVNPELTATVNGNVVKKEKLWNPNELPNWAIDKKENGGLIQYKGNSHDEGGIPVDQNGNPVGNFGTQAVAEVEHKETSKQGYVFSEKLKFPGSKKSFADVSKKLDKMKQFRPNDKITNDFVNGETDKLKELQESVKPIENTKKFAKGGKLPKYDGIENKGGLPYYDPIRKEYLENANEMNPLLYRPQTMNWGEVQDWTNNPISNTSKPTIDVNSDFKYNPNYEDGSLLQLPKIKKYNNDLKLQLALGETGNLQPYGNVETPEVSNLTNNPNYELYSGEVSAVPAILTGVGNLGLAALSASGKFDTKIPDIKAKTIQAKKINLAESRRRASEEATSAKNAAALQSRGLSGQEGTSYRLASNIAANKGLGNLLGESYLNEELQNTQAQARADEINSQALNQAEIYNAQNKYQADANRNAQTLQFLSKVLAAPIGYYNDSQQGKNYANMLNMSNPNYVAIVGDKGKMEFIPRENYIENQKQKLNFKVSKKSKK